MTGKDIVINSALALGVAWIVHLLFCVFAPQVIDTYPLLFEVMPITMFLVTYRLLMIEKGDIEK